MSNGVTKTLSVIIRKTYEGITDYMSERLHERFKIALGHDYKQIEAPNYFGEIVQSADYQINWLEFKNFNIAQAKFQVEVTPFDASNSNCATCGDVTQVVTNDDVFPDSLEEDTDYSLDVKDNDGICCFPITWTITSFNSTYLDSCTIDTDGTIHVHTKAGIITANGILLAVYRATCPNGSYDEANVNGNITGATADCLAPTDITASNIHTTDVRIDWVAPSPLPDHYFVKLYRRSDNVLISSFDIDSAFSFTNILLLQPGTDYQVFVRSQCVAGNDDDADASNFISVDFTTNAATQLCGNYTIAVADPTIWGPELGGKASVSYMDCNGIIQNTFCKNNNAIQICAAQTGPGSPTYLSISHPLYATILYNGIC
jgi:hypothetical protein